MQCYVCDVDEMRTIERGEIHPRNEMTSIQIKAYTALYIFCL
jgi:hypothetical protein